MTQALGDGQEIEGLRNLLEGDFPSVHDAISRRSDVDVAVPKFARRLLELLDKQQALAAVPRLATSLVGDDEEACRYFDEEVETYREAHQPIGLGIGEGPHGLLLLLEKQNPAPVKESALALALSMVEQRELSSDWMLTFYKRGGAHRLMCLLEPGRSCSGGLNLDISRVHAALQGKARGLEGHPVVGAFLMQAVDEFQDRLGGLCAMDVDRMRQHQKPCLDSFRRFLEQRRPPPELFPHVLALFQTQALLSLHADDPKRFRKLVLVSELVRQSFEMGLDKLFFTLDTIGFRLYLEGVERAVAQHEVLYRLLTSNKLGPFS